GQILSPDGAACHSPGRGAGGQYYGDGAWPAAAAVQVQDARHARSDWTTDRRGRNIRHEVLGNHRLVALARYLSKQTPGVPKKSPGGHRLGARSGFLEGHRSVADVAGTYTVGAR